MLINSYNSTLLKINYKKKGYKYKTDILSIFIHYIILKQILKLIIIACFCIIKVELYYQYLLFI
jgi:hypothetical protein